MKKTSYRRPGYKDLWRPIEDNSKYKSTKRMRKLNETGIKISGDHKGPTHWIMKVD